MWREFLLHIKPYIHYIRFFLKAVFFLLFSISALAHSHAKENGFTVPSGKLLTDLRDQIDIFHDKEHKTIKEMTSDEISNRFRPLHQRSMQFGFTDGAYWIRFTLDNPHSTLKTLYLLLKDPSLDNLQFYSPTNNDDFYQIQTGASFSFDSRPITSNRFILPIKLEANSKNTFYLRVSSEHPLDLNFRLMDANTFFHYQKSETFFFAFLLSIFVAFITYSLGSYIFFKQTAFFHLAMMGVWSLIFYLTKHGQLYQFIPNMVGWETQVKNAMACLVLFHFLAHHSYHLLTPKRMTTWLKITSTRLLPPALILLVFCSLFYVPYSEIITLWVTLTALACLTLMSILSYQHQIPYSRLFIAAHTSFIFPLIIYLLDKFSAFNFEWIAYNGFNASIIMYQGILILAVTLKERHNRQALAQKQLNEQLEKRSLKAKQEIVSRLNHSIRTPINGIMGMTDLLRDTSLSASQRDYLSTLHTSSLNLLQLITDELSMVNFDKNKLKLQKIPFDLNQTIIDGLNQVKHISERKGIELICSLSPELPSYVQGDPNRIQQVIRYLLTDLINQAAGYQHTSPEILLEVSRSKLNTNKQLNNLVCIQFNLSFSVQTKSSSSLDYSLPSNHEEPHLENKQSLEISKTLIELMGGVLNIPSLNDLPSISFTIHLPEDQSLENMEQHSSMPLNGLRVLVVDDSETCCRVIQQQLQSWQMQVTYCQSGIEAIAILNTQTNMGTPFDLIILDYKMPNMNGLELALKIQKDHQIKQDLLMIMLTGSMDAPTDESIRNSGIKCVLTKPVSSKALKITISQEISYLARFQQQAHKRDHSLILSTHKRLKVLVADQDPSSSKILEGMLSILGASAETVDNGMEALKFLQENRYNLALISNHLPLMNGGDVVDKFRHWEHRNNFPPTPIITMGAKEESTLAVNDTSHENVTYLSKPIALSQLQEVLEMKSSRLVEDQYIASSS